MPLPDSGSRCGGSILPYWIGKFYSGKLTRRPTATANLYFILSEHLSQTEMQYHFFTRSPFCFLHEYGGFKAEILPSSTAFILRNWRLQLDNTTAHRSQAAQHALLKNGVSEIFPACVLAWHVSNREPLALMTRRVVAHRASASIAILFLT